MRNNPLWFWLIITILLGTFIYLISPILLPFVMGLGIAYILDPVTDRLEEKGCSRTLATSIICGIFLFAVTLVMLIFIPLLLEQIGYFISQLPAYMDTIRERAAPYLERWNIEMNLYDKESITAYVKEFNESSREVVLTVVGGILKSGMAFVNFMALLVITPVVTFYLLRDWDRMVTEVNELLPREYAHIIREQLIKVDATLSAFLRGQINVMMTLAAFYAIALSAAGLSYGLLVAVIAGLLVIVPYVGTILSGAIAVGLAYMQFDEFYRVGIILGIFVAGQMLEGYVLTPRLIGKSVGLNPIWIIFGMMAGGALMGFVGILIAVPVTAVAGVLIRFAVSEYQKSPYYYGKQAPLVMPEGKKEV